MNKKSEVMNELEAASYIQMSRSFLRQARMLARRKHCSHAPTYIKLGRTVRYLKKDLDSWLTKHRVVERRGRPS